jgi:hypothetical protein
MTHFSRLFAWVYVVATGLPPAAPAQAPQVGQVQSLTVLTLSMQVGSTDSETRRVAYAPPPGWYVRGHEVRCTKKSGNTSYTVNTVPQDWSYISEEKVRDAYKGLLDLAAQAHSAGLRAKVAAEQEQLLNEVRKVRSTHHALVVDVTVRGEGFLRGGGSLELTVTAELVFVGTEETLAQAVARHKQALK